MALVGATILVSYGRNTQLSSSTSDFVQQLTKGGGGLPPGSRNGPASYGQPLMGAGKPLMKNGVGGDGVGNIIFDYDTESAEDYAADGETVVACLQVGYSDHDVPYE